MSLRDVVIDWLTASRYIKSLKARYIEQRQDYTERLAEKYARIRQLETECAGLKLECDRMRMVLLPLGSEAGLAYAERFNGYKRPETIVPEFDGPLDWQSEVQRMIGDNNGIPSEGRETVHQSAPDDAAQPQP